MAGLLVDAVSILSLIHISATGIGRETALLFAKEGADLALLTGKNQTALERVAEEVEKLGRKVYYGLADEMCIRDRRYASEPKI